MNHKPQWLSKCQNQKPDPKGEVYINFGYDGNYVNTQLRLLKTPELMREVVLQLGLYKDPNLFGKPNKGVIESLKSIFSKEKPSENSGFFITCFNRKHQ